MVCIVLFALAPTAQATPVIGSVTVTPANSSVTVLAGGSSTETVIVSPASKQLLPTCGMSTCPALCGEDGCLNANGECTCGGTTPQEYDTSISVATSNPAVATATYANGVLSITGVFAGAAKITLTGTLHEYSNGYASVDVTVNSAPASTLVVNLQPGWNLLAGSSGSNTGGRTLFGYDGTAYESVTADVLAAGHGYWCKSTSLDTATLSLAPAPISIDLQTGWNLIGNPTSAAVSLPSGLVAFVFSNGSYGSTTTIAPGQGAWVKSSVAQIVDLQ